MTLVLRSARTTDAGRTGAILSGFIDETDWMPRIHSRAQDLAHVGDLIDRGWVRVVEYRGQIAGFLARDGQVIQSLYVDMACRGRALGGHLLAEAKAQSDVLTLWTFEANLAAQRFYLKHGFVEQSRSDGAGNDVGLPDIEYMWRRTP